MFLQVVFRYLLARPLSWSEELARYLFVWVSLLGAAAGVGSSMKQGLDILTRYFPQKVQRVIDILVRASVIVFCGILVSKGIELTKIVHLQKSPAMRLPMSWVYSAVPVSAALMIFIAVTEFLSELGKGD
mgnify:FL=1